jgi:hypothetical protein
MWKYLQYLNIFQWCKWLRYLGHVRRPSWTSPARRLHPRPLPPTQALPQAGAHGTPCRPPPHPRARSRITRRAATALQVMVLLVLGIVGFSWYAVVPATYFPRMLRGPALASLGCALVNIAFTALVRRARALSVVGAFAQTEGGGGGGCRCMPAPNRPALAAQVRPHSADHRLRGTPRRL